MKKIYTNLSNYGSIKADGDSFVVPLFLLPEKAGTLTYENPAGGR